MYLAPFFASVILSIQKSWDGGKDIADTLEARKRIDMKKERPEREELQEVDAKKIAFEQESSDMAFKEDYKRFLGRSDLYERNLPRALTKENLLLIKFFSVHKVFVYCSSNSEN